MTIPELTHVMGIPIWANSILESDRFWLYAEHLHLNVKRWNKVSKNDCHEHEVRWKLDYNLGTALTPGAAQCEAGNQRDKAQQEAAPPPETRLQVYINEDLTKLRA